MIEWKEYKVGEVFECRTTKPYITPENPKNSGKYNYVSRRTTNNGIDGLVDIDNDSSLLNKGNCITIGAEGCVAFYQKCQKS